MGTWDIGPFDNDTAADFGDDLDEAAADEREDMVRSVLKRAAGPADFLGTSDGERASPPATAWDGGSRDGHGTARPAKKPSADEGSGPIV
ncbi:DUF4259 domain-containing protein [Streptomyces sp. NPDC020880]|uniref:DUF4259 domain-containing protein n=1 Tax=Streptomyces sp. NPDC020880 TaxID=3365098 RepID=UPI00384BE5E2